MAMVNLGPYAISSERDDEGYRVHNVSYKVMTDDPDDLPYTIWSSLASLPQTGDPWTFGNDNDAWSFCYPYVKGTPLHPEEEPGYWWKLDYKFSNKPLSRCQSTQIENPLSEPQKISGSYVRYMKEAKVDRNGKAILSSSHERIQGIQQNAGRHNVIIEQNVGSLGLSTVCAIETHLNDATLWGLDARHILFASWSWERKLYGTCTYYYTRRFEFEVRHNPDDTFDLDDVPDMGFKELDTTIVGADKNNPKHFRMIKDKNGENLASPVMLDNNGAVNTSPVATPSFRPTIELYDEANLLTLGIPSSL